MSAPFLTVCVRNGAFSGDSNYLAIRTLSKSDSMYTQVWLAVQLAGKVLTLNAPYGAVGGFNALNKTNLGTPNRFVNTPQFGTITMAMSPARELQVSARLSF
jgi:hypothetical protein